MYLHTDKKTQTKQTKTSLLIWSHFLRINCKHAEFPNGEWLQKDCISNFKVAFSVVNCVLLERSLAMGFSFFSR